MLNICLVGNAGGHMEQLKQLRGMNGEEYNLFFVTSKCPATENLEYISDFIKSPHGRNKVATICGYILNTIQAIQVMGRRKPEVIISTGDGICIPLCVMAKILKKKIVFIETFARIESPSKTGQLLYKFADVFIIQHMGLKQYYPRAIYGGWVY